MDKEVIETIGKEVKADVQKVEAKATEIAAEVKALSELNGKLQSQLDALEAKSNRLGKSAEGEVKSPLLAAIEAKSVEFSEVGNKPVTLKLDQKAAIDMLRGTAVGDSQALIGTGATVAQPNRLAHVRDYMRISPFSGSVLKYDRELAPEGKPAVVAEGQRKPKVSFKTEPVTANAEKIAMHYKMSDELLKDAPAFAASLKGRGIEMTLTEEDAQLIYGTGTSGNIQGIYPLASTFDAGTIKVDVPQNIDVLVVAAAQVRRSLYRANAIMMNPDDVTELELTKDEDGRYILPAALGAKLPSIGRVEIIELDAMNPGEFLVGAFDMGVDVYQVDNMTVKATDSNEDDFINNKITVVIEERLLQAVTRPSAFVKGTFAAAKAALAAVVA